MPPPYSRHMTGRYLVVCNSKQPQHIAPFVNQLKRRITITHPFHPKCG